MPKKETKYVCDICGEKFSTEGEAEKCEKQHYSPIEITYFRYDLKDRKKEYPSTINVKLKNGEGIEKTITYNRKSS